MGVFVPADDGRWVSEEFARLAEIVQEYDSALELRWIPPEHRTRDDKKPYVIVDSRSNYPVLYASELDTPAEILASLFQADNERNGYILPRLEAMEGAQKILDKKAQMEQFEEAADRARFLMKSPLHSNRMDGKKYDDQLRVVGPAVDRRYIV